MTDRLTQVQICLDQLVAQFNATVNYVDMKSNPAPLDGDPSSVIDLAANAPLPGTRPPDGSGENSSSDGAAKRAQPPFEIVIDELATDIILKSRQISMIIDSLPGIGALPESQLNTINNLIRVLKETEEERVKKIEEKDKLLRWCEELVLQVSDGIYSTRT